MSISSSSSSSAASSSSSLPSSSSLSLVDISSSLRSPLWGPPSWSQTICHLLDCYRIFCRKNSAGSVAPRNRLLFLEYLECVSRKESLHYGALSALMDLEVGFEKRVSKRFPPDPKPKCAVCGSARGIQATKILSVATFAASTKRNIRKTGLDSAYDPKNAILLCSLCSRLYEQHVIVIGPGGFYEDVSAIEKWHVHSGLNKALFSTYITKLIGKEMQKRQDSDDESEYDLGILSKESDEDGDGDGAAHGEEYNSEEEGEHFSEPDAEEEKVEKEEEQEKPQKKRKAPRASGKGKEMSGGKGKTSRKRAKK